MKQIIIALLLLTGTSSVFAQMPEINVPKVDAPTNNGISITGTVYDSLANIPLEYSSAMLAKLGQKAGDGINSDSLGHFEFKNVKPGSYELTLFYVGYNKLVKSVTVTESSTNMDLGKVNMNNKSTSLKEVEVVDMKQLIEQRPDGMVYNAEKDFTNKGTTADMVLRKVPMVTVDMQGNVAMRGNSNVKVLIDGKPSTMIAASVSDALKQIPSDNIKSVEVITSPGAKYDGEGSAGVINIITKKNIIKGISGNMFGQLSYNVPREFYTGNAGLSMNYRNKNFGLSLNAGVSRWQMVIGSESVRTNDDGSQLKQSNQMDGAGNFYWSQLSADYQIDSLQSIQVGVGYHPGTWKQDQPLTNIFTPTSLIPGMDFQSNTHTESPRNNYAFNAAYSKKFKNNPKRTLDILSQYSLNSKTSKYEMLKNNIGSDTVIYKENNVDKSQNNEFTIQADYVQPLKNPKQKIETGLKYINRSINSDFQLQYWNLGNTDFAIDPNRTNSLDYTQQVAAGYAQFTTPLTSRISMIAGARYEFTNIDGHQDEASSHFSAQYNNVLPNLNLAYTFKNFSKLKLSYNMRINRPSIDFVNPYVNYSDPYNLKQGNQYLVPERTHNVEMTYSTFFNNTNLNWSAFYRHTGNAIENVTYVDAFDTSHTSYQNVAKNNTIGLDFFGSATFFKNWMINLNGSAYYMMLKSPSLNVKNDGFQYSASMYTSYKLSKLFSIAGFAMYNGNQIQLQGSQDGWYYYFLGLQMSLFKDKATINLSGENFFTPEVKMATRYTYQNAEYVNHSTYYGRGLRLTFSWSFGKMTFSQKKKIDNDDLKSNSDGQPGMGGGK
jgi:ferric enterobactin receptor